jgi:hypothetical protein
MSGFYSYNRIPETGQFIKKRNLFLTALEPGKSNVKVLVSGEVRLAA